MVTPLQPLPQPDVGSPDDDAWAAGAELVDAHLPHLLDEDFDEDCAEVSPFHLEGDCAGHPLEGLDGSVGTLWNQQAHGPHRPTPEFGQLAPRQDYERRQRRWRSYAMALYKALNGRVPLELVAHCQRFVLDAVKKPWVLDYSTAHDLVQAAGLKSYEDYKRFHEQHGEALWLPRFPEEQYRLSRPSKWALFLGQVSTSFNGSEQFVGEPTANGVMRPPPDEQRVQQLVEKARYRPAGSPKRPYGFSRLPQGPLVQGPLSLLVSKELQTVPPELAHQAREQSVARATQKVREQVLQLQAQLEQLQVSRAHPGAKPPPESGAISYLRHQFARAQAQASELGCKSVADYLMLFIQGRLDVELPLRPDLAYLLYWEGWGPYLGLSSSEEDQGPINFLPDLTPEGFVEFDYVQEYARSLSLGSVEEWYQHKHHHAVPVHVDEVYAGLGFTTWASFLGLLRIRGAGPKPLQVSRGKRREPQRSK